MTQNRWKSKVLWLAVASLITFLLTQYGLWHWVGLDEGAFTKVVDLILVVLGLLGIINNPTDPENL